MDFAQTSIVSRRLEKEDIRNRVWLAESKLKQIQIIHRNYQKNSEFLLDDARCALEDTEKCIERTRRLHEEARAEKEQCRRLRKCVRTLEKEMSQIQQPGVDGKEAPYNNKCKDADSSHRQPSTSERILATFVTCVGSVFVYGLYKLTAPFLI